MSSNLVIVAIPAQDDRVWKVSSEKIPHLTLLFLGDAEANPNVNRIAQFVWHAVTTSEHGPFMLRKDYRDVLGEDKADVIHFEKDWSFKWVQQFRHQLLQNTDIRAAYDSVEQYDEWQPHLTLGYPETPAKELENEYDLDWITFDRIAVWTGDYEGPEFRLKWAERYNDDIAVAYSEAMKTGETAVEGFLEHYGVKGMKWGQRKDYSKEVPSAGLIAYAGFLNLANPKFRETVPASTKTKVSLFGVMSMVDPSVRKDLKQYEKVMAIQKGDQEFDKGLKSGEAWIAVNNASATHFNKGIGALNAKHNPRPNEDWANEQMDAPKSPGFKKYMKEVNELSRQSLEKAANELQTTNPSGTKKVNVIPGDIPGDFRLSVEEVKHAEESPDLLVRLKYKTDDRGFIIGFEIDEDDEFAHLADLGAEFLEHYGVKGMKWGVRKQRFQSKLHERRVTSEEKTRAKRPARDVKAYPTIGTSKRQKARVDTKGGEDFPPTQDAIKVAVAKRKLQKSGTDALTNKELQDLQTRMNLEANVTRLTGTKKSSKGKQFIEGLLGRGNEGNLPNQAGRGARKLVGPAARRAARKVVLKV